MSEETMSYDEALQALTRAIIELQEKVDQLEADLEDLSESFKEPKRILTLN